MLGQRADSAVSYRFGIDHPAVPHLDANVDADSHADTDPHANPDENAHR